MSLLLTWFIFVIGLILLMVFRLVFYLSEIAELVHRELEESKNEPNVDVKLENLKIEPEVEEKKEEECDKIEAKIIFTKKV
jgi:regulatory protein YycI of two-component signal transduction system YycFG